VAESSRRFRNLVGGPVVPYCTVVAVSLLFTFFFGPIVRHHHVWEVSGDLWKSYEGGLYMAWGDFATALTYVSAPGTAILLAPPAFVAFHLGLVSGYPYWIPEPGSWLVLGPYVIPVSGTVVFAADHLIRRLGVAGGRRTACCWLVSAFAAPVTVIVGHPEDVVAMAISLVAASYVVDGRWNAAGLLFGLAFLFQPLVILLVLPMLSLTGPRTWIRALGLMILPTAAVVATPLAETGGDLGRFARQPIFAAPNHPTPLYWLSASAGKGLVSVAPERATIVVIAGLIGLWAWRRGVGPVQGLWCGAAAMSIRFILEPVDTPYYLWPAVTLFFIVIATGSARSSWIAVIPLSAATAYAYRHTGIWAYWLPLGALIVVAAALTGRSAFARRVEGADHVSPPLTAPATGGGAVPVT
jgi:hypothetical protein